MTPCEWRDCEDEAWELVDAGDDGVLALCYLHRPGPAVGVDVFDAEEPNEWSGSVEMPALVHVLELIDLPEAAPTPGGEQP